MSDIRVNLKTHLLATAGVTALVTQRVFELDRPQGSTLDCIVFRMLSAAFGDLIDGDSGEREARFEIVAWASTLERAIAIKDVLHGLYHTQSARYAMGDMTINYSVKITEYDGDRVRDAFADEGAVAITSVFEFTWDV